MPTRKKAATPARKRQTTKPAPAPSTTPAPAVNTVNSTAPDLTEQEFEKKPVHIPADPVISNDTAGDTDTITGAISSADMASAAVSDTPGDENIDDPAEEETVTTAGSDTPGDTAGAGQGEEELEVMEELEPLFKERNSLTGIFSRSEREYIEIHLQARKAAGVTRDINHFIRQCVNFCINFEPGWQFGRANVPRKELDV